MMKNRRVILFSLVMVLGIACANTIITKDADIRFGSGTEGKYHKKLNDGEKLAQSNNSDEKDTMHFLKGNWEASPDLKRFLMMKNA